MVVGITIATITYLVTRGGADEVSVFLSQALREAAEAEVEDPSLRAQCLGICDELQQRVAAYDALVAESLEAYLVGVEDYWSTAADQGRVLDPIADARESTLLACLDARERLVSLLDEPTWQAVFGTTDED